jgi:hypothetical protein
MKLYHATTKENWEKIQKDGLRGTCSFCGLRGCPLCAKYPEKLKFVYFTDDLNVVQRWGEVILEVEKESLDQTKLGTFREGLCDIMKTTPFYNYCLDVPPHLVKRFDCVHSFREGWGWRNTCYHCGVKRSSIKK